MKLGDGAEIRVNRRDQVTGIQPFSRNVDEERD